MNQSSVSYYFAERKGDAREQLPILRQRVYDRLRVLANKYNGAVHVGYVCLPVAHPHLPNSNHGVPVGFCDLYNEMAPHGYSPANMNYNVIAKLVLSDMHHEQDIATLCQELETDLNISLVVTIPRPQQQTGISSFTADAK